eukprot:15346156-Ditylum_brightwellii.AAC.1
MTYSACEPLAEYLLAVSAFGKETGRLLVNSLKALGCIHSKRGGNETFRSCLMTGCIMPLMRCPEKAHFLDSIS